MMLLSISLIGQGMIIVIKTFSQSVYDPIVIVDLISTTLSFILGLILCSVNNFNLLMKYNFTSLIFKIYCLSTIAKFLAVVTFFRRIREMKVILDVMVKSALFLIDLIGMMGIVMLLFSSIGISMFGGVINSSNIPHFEEITGEPFDGGLEFFNFNDYVNALICLYSIILAGWQDFLRMTCFANPNRSFVHNYYFVLFFLVANMFLLNILIGFIIDNIVEYLCDDINDDGDEDNIIKDSQVYKGVLNMYAKGRENIEKVGSIGKSLLNTVSGE